jgi:hypothetical protein
LSPLPGIDFIRFGYDIYCVLAIHRCTRGAKQRYGSMRRTELNADLSIMQATAAFRATAWGETTAARRRASAVVAAAQQLSSIIDFLFDSSSVHCKCSNLLSM